MKLKNKIARLTAQKNKLSHELATVTRERENQSAVIQNSLTQLVQGASAQANITSLNPLLQNNIYSPLTIQWLLLTYMYKTHGIIQTAIDMPVLDALRGGLELKSDQLGVDELKDVENDLEEDGILEALSEATIWKRLYGGAALIINTDQDPETQLDIKRVKRFELYAANRWELVTSWKPGQQSKLYEDFSPYEGAAARDSEFVYFYGRRIHRSRMIILSGKAAPYVIRWQLQGWGMSEVERMVEDFNLYLRTKDVLFDLLKEAKVDVYLLDGLKNQLASQAGTELTQKRVELMNQMKSFNSAIVMDKLDVFEQKIMTFTGISEVMKENRIGIASALRMPLSKLFGLGAQGFNSGEDDIENYNAMVESEVRTPMRRGIKLILNLISQVKFGSVMDIQYGFKPLRVMSSKEEEEINTSKTNRYLANYDRMLLTSQEIGEIQQKENMIPIETEAARGVLDEHPMPESTGDEDPDGGDDDK